MSQKIKNALTELSKYSFILGVVNENKRERKKGQSITNSELLIIHEFGSPVRKIPKRPILQYAIESEWVNKVIEITLNQCVEYVLLNEESKIRPELDKTAMRIESFIRRSLYNGSHNLKPLSNATVERKGSDLPLFDTGQLARSIVCQVVKK